ncbi:hypothetical protein [Brevundimonas sp. Root1423]|uniref:hypothetical protein n=1 Tax=Brevundimonas sp. Root1423 TaxID=1736462 RepID=UPI0006F68663|nr:hypothetical protein [Brevundimonas sp. Root1423]KQY85028.1 hypothetical protein ASD25_08540 [Brevundimonas sp. Root1423]
MERLISLTLFALALVTAPSAWAQTTTTSMAGIGDSEERPVGAWTLPDGIVLARPITGYSVFTPELCEPAEEPVGSGDLVQLCISLRHTGQRNGAPYRLPIHVEIPAGLIFISDNLSTQNGIILQRFIVEVRPGQTINIPVFAMCANDGRSGSNPSAGYQLGPVLQNPAFDALFKQLEGKRIPQTGAVDIQAAVWAIAEGDPVSPRHQAYIDALPDA